MLYFSPLSVTDDKQLDRKHPFSFPQCKHKHKHKFVLVCVFMCVFITAGLLLQDRVCVYYCRTYYKAVLDL